jgi:hypothetical protein
MTVRYHQRGDVLRPNYVCQREGIERGTPICQDVPGAGVDDAVGDTLVAMMTPVALEVALTVQHELATRIDEANKMRKQQVERARYEADLARRRFMQVDPDNRLVADSLEAEWNERLRDLARAQEDYERRRAADTLVIDEQQRSRLFALATDFPKLWRAPKTSMRDRKRMVRLLVDDVTLVRAAEIHAHLRLRGGTTHSLVLPLPKSSWELRQTPADVIREIDTLLDQHTDTEIADILNERGRRSGEGLAFSRRIVLRLRRDHGLTPRSDRLRASGMLTLREMARKLGVSTSTVKLWASAGLLRTERYNDKGQRLYAPLDGATLRKRQGSKLSRRLPGRQIASHRAKEV